MTSETTFGGTIETAFDSKIDSTGGTPEQTSLTVRLLDDVWIVENAVGQSLGDAKNRDDAVQIAREVCQREKASGISVLSVDGLVAMTIDAGECEAAGSNDPARAPEPNSAYDEIALRAYFIALERHARGEPGDVLQDWVEAERQLRSRNG